MAKEYKIGEKYYLPIIIDSVERRDVEFSFVDGASGDSASIVNKPDLLLTAYEVYECQVTALKDEIATLKSENERLSKQNEELGTKVEDLEAKLEEARHINDYAVANEQSRAKQVAEQRELMKKYSVVIDVLIDKITALKKGESNG